MFESLTDRFEGIFTKLRGKGKLSESDVDEVLREIRLALLEADVNLSVVKTLLGRIRERALGEEVSGASTPPSRSSRSSTRSSRPPSAARPSASRCRPSRPPSWSWRPAGLGQDHLLGQAGPLVQGPGAQSAAGGGRHLTPGGHRPARAPWPPRWACRCSPHRMTRSARQRRPVAVAAEAVAKARATGRDVLIVDTAGRLHIDDELMDQVRRHRRRGAATDDSCSWSTP